MVLRPMKKPRTDRDGSASGSSNADIEMPPFFHIIPHELLENILRLISQLPLAENWNNHITLRNLVKLYRVNGVLGMFLNRRFRTLCISKEVDCAYEHRNYNWKIPNDNMLWTNSIDVSHDFVLRGGGNLCVLWVRCG